MDNVFFVPGANPPFPGYEEWLEEVRRAPIWQAKAPRPYVPDMRDGLGKDKFPPPPPRSNLEPRQSKNYDRDTALAAMRFIWINRPDLVWETLWHIQYAVDDPDEGSRTAENQKYDVMHIYAVMYELRKEFPNLDNSRLIDLRIELHFQVAAIFPSLPLLIRRAPWLGENGLISE